MSKFPVSQVKSYFYIFYGKSNPLFSRLELPQFTHFIPGIPLAIPHQNPMDFPHRLFYNLVFQTWRCQCFIVDIYHQYIIHYTYIYI